MDGQAGRTETVQYTPKIMHGLLFLYFLIMPTLAGGSASEGGLATVTAETTGMERLWFSLSHDGSWSVKSIVLIEG